MCLDSHNLVRIVDDWKNSNIVGAQVLLYGRREA